MKEMRYPIDKVTIREAILDRIDQLGITRHKIAHSGVVEASPTTIFRYLSGESDSSAIVIEGIMFYVGLELAVNKNFA